MNLEHWLRAMNMETNELADMIGCSRQVLWKVKRGIPIDPRFAKKIVFITGGRVKPITVPQGRPKL